jgi:cold shock CspA family protein
MATGTLKMWKAERGFGFILNDAGGPDMFLHHRAAIRRHRSRQPKVRRATNF